MINRLTFGAVRIPTTAKNTQLMERIALAHETNSTQPSNVEVLAKVSQAALPKNSWARAFNPEWSGEIIIDPSTPDEFMKKNLSDAGFEAVEIIQDTALRQQNQELFDATILDDECVIRPSHW